MKQFVVCKDVAYAAKTGGGTVAGSNDVDQLAVGAVAFIDLSNNTLITTSSTVVGPVLFYATMADGTLYSSPLIPKGSYSGVQDYTAPEKEIQYIGNDGSPATITSGVFNGALIGLKLQCTTASTSGDYRAGTTALLKVVSGHTGVANGTELAANTDLVLGAVYEIISAGLPDAYGGGVLTPTGYTYSLNLPTLVAGEIAVIKIQKQKIQRYEVGTIRNYEYTVKTGDVALDVVTGLVAAINANATDFMTATAVSNIGIKLAAENFGESFSVTTSGILAASEVMKADVGKSNVIITGLGDSTSITIAEDENSVQRGNTSRLELNRQHWQEGSNVVVGETYNVYYFTWTQDNPGLVSNTVLYTHHLFFAYPDGGTGESDMVAALAKV
jgi:hypothetical protein